MVYVAYRYSLLGVHGVQCNFILCKQRCAAVWWQGRRFCRCVTAVTWRRATAAAAVLCLSGDTRSTMQNTAQASIRLHSIDPFIQLAPATQQMLQLAAAAASRAAAVAARGGRQLLPPCAAAASASASASARSAAAVVAPLPGCARWMASRDPSEVDAINKVGFV